ncbi:hypothetical protein EDD85DRAFT_793505 [Armillaria nabsnona]|nr:hypothetical protein EDD85DRAFT_793505 [Armillaria nabsnona]
MSSQQSPYNPYGYDKQEPPRSYSNDTPSHRASRRSSASSQWIGRTSHETQPWGPATPAGPQLQSRNPFRQNVYGLRTPTIPGALQRLLSPTTPTGRSGHGTAPQSMSSSATGTSPSRYWTPPTSPKPSTWSHPTSPLGHYRPQGPIKDSSTPRSEPDSQNAPERYPFLSPMGYDYDDQYDRRILGLTRIPTPVLNQTPSPRSGDEDSESEGTATPSGIPTPLPEEVPPTPSILTGSTTSGMSSNRSTETSSVPTESMPGNSDAPMSKPERSGPTRTPVRTWSISSPSTEELPSPLDNPEMLKSRHGYTPTGFRNYSDHIPATDAPIYTPEPKRNSASYSASSFTYPGYRETVPTWTDPPTNPFDGFQYAFEPGFKPSQIPEDVPDFYVGPSRERPGFYPSFPQPLPDSPPDSRRLGYYTGKKTSRRFAGAGPEGEMEGLEAGGSGQAPPPNDAQ